MKTIITAHSGSENTPDNSMEYLRTALTLSCDALEIDIMPVNGELRLTHDVPETPESAPLLSECLDMFAASSVPYINCDVKTEGIVDEVLAMGAERGICSRMIFTGYVITPDEIRRIRAAGAQWWYNVPADAGTSPADFIALMSERGADCANNHFSAFTPDLLTALNAASLTASAWTVNDEAELERLLRAGVHNITTRRPTIALRMREAIQG